MNISQESIGTVERIISTGGFGFVSMPDHEGDIFFHRKQLAAALDFDDGLVRRRVKFKLVETKKGWTATDVRPAD